MAYIVFFFGMFIITEFGESQTSYRRKKACESGRITRILPIPTLLCYQQK